MKQYVMNMEPQLIKEVDEIIRKEKLHNSRNEFVRDAVRSKVLEYRKLKIRNALKTVGKHALENGWDGKMPAKKKSDQIAKEFLKKKELSNN